MFQRVTASLSRIWAQHLATDKGWNTNILMCLSHLNQCRNCVWSGCNNYARSGCAVMYNIPGQMLQALFNGAREIPANNWNAIQSSPLSASSPLAVPPSKSVSKPLNPSASVVGPAVATSTRYRNAQKGAYRTCLRYLDGSLCRQSCPGSGTHQYVCRNLWHWSNL